MTDFKLDRNAFWSGTHEEQELRDREISKNMSVEERLRASWYLTLRAYGYDPENPPRMDKTVFSVRKRS